ncbi:MAG: squalene synthase HpnC [Thermoleophilia bacterium]|nr:squalene synthase HpnC [Thermoleophilia bacterium]
MTTGGTAPGDLDGARARVAAITRDHDENFPIAFALAPRDVRSDMRALYAYCRITDDIGDAGDATVTQRLAALDAWEADLVRAVHGTADDPVLVAVADVIRRRSLDTDLFTRVIEANRMDQRTSRWESHEDLLHYCAHSATPVGRMVLGVLGRDDARRVALSDATCEGLQLVNFWQDIGRDLVERDRVYLPRDDMASFGVTDDALRAPTASPAVRSVVRMEVGRARARLVQGAPLWGTVPIRVRLDIGLFTAGGLWVCDAIAARDFDTIAARPAPGVRGRLRMVGGVVARLVRGGGTWA